MTYEDSLRFIHSLDKYGSRPGLDRIQRLADLVPGIMDQRFIHVAGTNGKGSVCKIVERILSMAAYRVGMFTSPYITDYRDQIQISGTPVCKEDFAAAVEYLMPKMQQLSAEGVIITEFEFLTVLALTVFKRAKCDFVICEAGMGGLLDATNIIKDPLIAVITRIDIDHTAFLGDTVEAIAYQKAGIIKENCVTVLSHQKEEAYSVIASVAKSKNSDLWRAGDTPVTVNEVTRDGTSFTYRGEEMRLSLVGRHQIENLRCALTVIEALRDRYGVQIKPAAVSLGVQHAKEPARFEKLHDDPTVILDGAHNPNGMRAFAQTVRELYPEGDKTLVIGMLADKDHAALQYLKGLFTRAVVTDIDNPRALPAQELAQKLCGISADIEVIGDVREAYEKALSYGDDIFICGSLYLAREIRPEIIVTGGK